MRAVVQRVARCSVAVAGRAVAEIGAGLLAYVGIAHTDGDGDAAYLADKILHLRIFPDGEGKMNLSLLESGGELLVVSQFTLLADARNGRRPSLSAAAEGGRSLPLYVSLLAALTAAGARMQHGEFGALMDVTSTNHGPVTILLDSTRLF